MPSLLAATDRETSPSMTKRRICNEDSRSGILDADAPGALEKFSAQELVGRLDWSRAVVSH
jgi:hypothetical protein